MQWLKKAWEWVKHMFIRTDENTVSAQKPPFVYHGSCKGIEGPLTPRPQKGDINGDFPDGIRNVVFATHDQNLAALYTLKNEYMLSTGVHQGLNFSFLRDYDGWKAALDSAACSVYALPSENFINTLNKKDGTSSIEWQSPVAVTPAKIIRYTPETVMQTGAQLFFLDEKIQTGMWHYDEKEDSDFSFMNKAISKWKSGALPESFTMLHLARELIDAGLMKHLNAETDIRPIDLPKSPHADVIKDDIDWLKQQAGREQSAMHYRTDWSKNPRNQPGGLAGVSLQSQCR